MQGLDNYHPSVVHAPRHCMLRTSSDFLLHHLQVGDFPLAPVAPDSGLGCRGAYLQRSVPSSGYVRRFVGRYGLMCR